MHIGDNVEMSGIVFLIPFITLNDNTDTVYLSYLNSN